MGGCGGGGTGAAAPPAPREPSGVTFRLLRFGTDGLWSSCVKVVAIGMASVHMLDTRAPYPLPVSKACTLCLRSSTFQKRQPNADQTRPGDDTRGDARAHATIYSVFTAVTASVQLLPHSRMHWAPPMAWHGACAGSSCSPAVQRERERIPLQRLGISPLRGVQGTDTRTPSIVCATAKLQSPGFTR